MEYRFGHVRAEEHCIFCTFPAKCNTTRKKAGAWEQDAFFFCCLPNKNANPPTQSGYLTRDLSHVTEGISMGPDLVIDEPTKEFFCDRESHLCNIRLCPRCNLDKTAHMVHFSCLRLAMNQCQGEVDFSLRLLCETAWYLRPLVPWVHRNTDSYPGPRLDRFPRCEVSSETDLGRLIRRVTQLPPEVESVICDHIEPSQFSALSICVEAVAWVKKNMASRRQEGPLPMSASITIQPTPSLPRPVTGVVANSRLILGQACLTSVSAVHTESAQNDHQISLLEKQAQGAQYVLGTYGVVAIRFLYVDGSWSPWLGEPYPQKWIRYIPLSNIGELKVISDGFKILSCTSPTFENQPKYTIQYGVKPDSVVWDRDVGSHGRVGFSMLNLGHWNGPQLRGHGRARTAEYLSLGTERDPISCLTVYWTGFGIVSAQVNNDPRRTVGEPTSECCVTTHYFQPGELVRSVYLGERDCMMRSEGPSFREMTTVIPPNDEFATAWTRTSSDHTIGPYLMLLTSSGRFLYYGPCTAGVDYSGGFSISEVGWHDMTWDRNLHYRVLGIFFSAMSIERGAYRLSGAVLERSTPPADPPPDPEIQVSVPKNLGEKSPRGRYGLGAGLTKATFIDVQHLQLQRTRQQCTGLRAHFSNGTSCILGQWDASNLDGISSLYRKSDDILHAITFVYGHEKGEFPGTWIKDIVLNNRPVEDAESSFTWNDLYQELAWWYNCRHASVELWEGREYNRNAIHFHHSMLV